MSPNSYYKNSMTRVAELGTNAYLLASRRDLKQYGVIKVLVICRGLIKEYKNDNAYFSDFNAYSPCHKEKKNAEKQLFSIKTCYIKNEKLENANSNFVFVHKDFEVLFNNILEIVECKSQFKTQQLLNGFISFDEAEKITYGTYFGKFLFCFALNDSLPTCKVSKVHFNSSFLLNYKHDDMKDMYYKFNDKVIDIDNNHDPGIMLARNSIGELKIDVNAEE
ncbi:hypothetical protein H5410_047501 [Solanum commersonii]|uniref:Uncharacterized protein n=1 Tax=Solanum commersonii TaxID=4109 RepID=A0A9J5XFB8_SOLCO|nr:hypothetical protein H5410_047501 [Solanum commersonii]